MSLKRSLLCLPVTTLLVVMGGCTPSDRPAQVSVETYPPNPHSHSSRLEQRDLEFERRGFDVTSYTLDLEFDATLESVTATAVIAATVTETPPAELVLDLRDLTVTGLLVDGTAATYTHDPSEGLVRIQPPTALTALQPITITVDYSGEPGNDTTDVFLQARGEGVLTNEARDFVWTWGQPTGSRHWFPCVDHPSDKATLTVALSVPEPYMAIGVGQPVGAPTSFDNGGIPYRRYEWAMPQPVATFLAAFYIGEFDEFTLPPCTSEDPQPCEDPPVPVTAYVPSSIRLQDVEDTGLAAIREGFRVLGPLFGPYPFDSFGVVYVPEEEFAGLEHQTMVLMSDRFLRNPNFLDTTLVHELAHQWIGNSATPADHDNYFLTEGLATFAQRFVINSFTRFDAPVFEPFEISQPDIALLQNDVILSNLPFDDEFLIANIVYGKGLGFYSMLADFLGPDAFAAGLQQFFADNRFGNVTPEHLQVAMENASGVSLQVFFDQWVRDRGFAVLGVDCQVFDVPFSETVQVTCGFTQVQNDLTALREYWQLNLSGNGPNNPYALMELTVPIDFGLNTVEVVFNLEPRRSQVLSACVARNSLPEAIRVDPRRSLYGITLNRSEWIFDGGLSQADIEMTAPNSSLDCIQSEGGCASVTPGALVPCVASFASMLVLRRRRRFRGRG